MNVKRLFNKARQLTLSALLVVGLILPVFAGPVTPAKAASTDITIFHTNDMHGSEKDFGYLKALKESHPGSILVDAGDSAQGSSLATYTEGKAVIELMNAAGYDGMVLGNHEFDYGTAATLEMARTATFPVVSANSFDKNSNLLLAGINGGNGQHFIKEVDGIKVGFFGITTTETAYKTNPTKLDGVTFGSEIEYARQQVAALETAGADIIIGLMHVGIDATSDPTSHKIAAEVAGIDVIIDGHSHSTGSTAIGNTTVAQTGTKLANVGQIVITVDDVTGDIDVDASLLAFNDIRATYTEDAAYAALYASKIADLAPILNEVIARTNTTIFADAVDGTRVSRLEETPMSSLVADAMRWEGERMLSGLGYTHPVVALQNGGGVRANIASGNITVDNVLSVLPFGNLISVKEITPNILYEALENGYQDMAMTPEGYLDATRARGAFAQISGMRVVIDADQPAGNKVKELYLVNEATGAEVLLNRADTTTTIAIVSNDFNIAGGDQYGMLSNLNHIAEGGTLDKVLKEYIQKHSVNGIFEQVTTKGRILVEQIESIQNTGYVDIKPDITLTPNTEYTVTVDGVKTIKVTTDASGNFVLSQVTNGVHAINVDGRDYYVSSFTKVGLLDVVVVNAPVDKSALEALVNTAEKIDRDLYTKESLVAFDKALEEAKAVLADPNATQDEIDAALKVLQDAINNLVKVDFDKDKDKDKGDKDKDKGKGKDKGGPNQGNKNPENKAPNTSDTRNLIWTALAIMLASLLLLARRKAIN